MGDREYGSNDAGNVVNQQTQAHRVPSQGDAVAGSVNKPRLIPLQLLAGNRAVTRLLTQDPTITIQRAPRRGSGGDDDDDMPRDRSRRARPRNAPSGTVPIDQSGLDRETIHKIKDAIGAAPDTWVGVTPDGHIVTGDNEGNIEDHGHVSDYARMGGENIPKWVWALLGTAAAIALIVLFVTGVGELAVILAGLGWAATAIIVAVLRASGRDVDAPGTTASAEQGQTDSDPEFA